MPSRRRSREPTAAERRAARPANVDPGQAYSIDEFCAALDCSRAQFYRLRDAGRLKLIPAIDSRPRVAGAEILRLIGVATPQMTA
jgi:hypothetical protein